MQVNMTWETKDKGCLETVKEELTKKVKELEKTYPVTCTQMHTKMYQAGGKVIKDYHKKRI